MFSLVFILVTLLLVTFFSGMETAYRTSGKLTLELGVKIHPVISWLIRKMTADQSLFTTTLAIGFTLSLVIFTYATAFLIESEYLNSIPSFFLRKTVEIIFIAFIVFLFGLFIPKILFRISPESILRLFSLPLAVLYVVLFPLAKILHFIFNTHHTTVGNADNVRKISLFAHHDFLRLNDDLKNHPSATENSVEKEVILIRNTLDFSRVRLREIMVPRNEIALLDIHSDIETLRKRFIETGYSRILFYEDNKDNIVGYVHSSAIFQNARQIKPFLKNVLIVPETMAANRLLSRFIREHRSIALVVDEFGGTAGLVTTEDILEEIFGEIEDEHDIRAIFEKKLNDRQFILSGRYEIDAMNEKYHWNIPESDQYETLAGFILYYNDSIPAVNEIIKIGRWSIKILKATTTKIELVQVTLPDSD